MEYRLYRASGKAPVQGILLFLLAGLLGCFLLEGLYVTLMEFVSHLFLRAVIIVATISAMTAWMVLMIRIGKIRSSAVVRGIGLVIVILSYYFGRVVYVDLVEALWQRGANEVLKSADSIRLLLVRIFQLLIRPDIVLAALGQILPYGTMSINGAMLTGVPLLLCWIVEAAVFIILPFYLTIYYAQRPYDEERGVWYPKKEEWHVNYVEGYREIRAEMRKGNVRLLLQALKELKSYQLQGQESYAIVTFYRRHKEVGPYVSLVNVKAVQSGPRRLDHRTITLCRLLDIGQDDAKELYDRVKNSYQEAAESAAKPKLSDRLSRASFDLTRASRSVAQELRKPVMQESKTLTVYTPTPTEQLSLDDLRRGLEEVTVHVPHVTPEMEKEYLNRKKD